MPLQVRREHQTRCGSSPRLAGSTSGEAEEVPVVPTKTEGLRPRPAGLNAHQMLDHDPEFIVNSTSDSAIYVYSPVAVVSYCLTNWIGDCRLDGSRGCVNGFQYENECSASTTVQERFSKFQ